MPPQESWLQSIQSGPAFAIATTLALIFTCGSLFAVCYGELLDTKLHKKALRDLKRDHKPSTKKWLIRAHNIKGTAMSLKAGARTASAVSVLLTVVALVCKPNDSDKSRVVVHQVFEQCLSLTNASSDYAWCQKPLYPTPALRR